jgi:thiamine-monophosphate kinase
VRAALTDGEDYELVFALARGADRTAFAAAWRRAFPRTRLSCIGHFARGSRLPAGCIDLAAYHGYEHLR